MSTKRKKLFVITGVFPPMPMAEADHIARLCGELAGRGYDVEVLTSVKGSPAMLRNCRVHAVVDRWDWSARAQIAHHARQFNPDIVFMWYVGMAYDYHPMITFAASHLKAVIPNAKIVTQMTAPVGSQPHKFPKATRVLRKAVAMATGGKAIDFHYGTLLRDSDHVIIMADSHKQQLANVHPGVVDKSSLVPPPPLIPMSPATAATRNKGRELLGAKDDTILFGFFGRLYKGKGLEQLITAFKQVHAANPKTRLAIIGGPTPTWLDDDWRHERLQDQARDLGIDHAITWTGEFPFESDAGSTYLRAVDFVVLPFDWGAALNNSSIAACASHDLPMLATLRDPPDPDLIDGENVLLCQPRDPEVLAAAMQRLMNDPALAQRLREGSADLTRRHFSWATSVDRTIAAFNLAAAKPATAAA